MTQPPTLALITGASLGIGAEFAHELARHGHDVILVARSAAKLDALAADLQRRYKVRTHVMAMDLGRPRAGLELYNRCKAQQLNPDILVNNAGFGDVGEFVHAENSKLEEMISLNIETLTLLCRYFGADMKTRRYGRILNVASTAAFQPGPYMAVYYATKAYVVSFSEALAYELRSSGVSVTTLCPGPTVSGFQARAGLENAVMVKVPWVMTSKAVAAEGYSALMSQKGLHISGFMNWLMAFMNRFAPRSVAMRVAGHFNSRRD